MNTVEEQSHRAEKMVKRGLAGRETSPNEGFPLDQHKLCPANTYEVNTAYLSRARLLRGFEEKTPRRYILSVVSVLSILALTGVFIFAHSIGGSPTVNESAIKSHRSLSPFQKSSWAAENIWETSELIVEESTGSQRAKLGSSRSVLHSARNSDADTDLDVNTHDGEERLPPGCSKKSAKLKIFMYDLPSEFHYGMLLELAYNDRQFWPKNVSDVPMYPGGLYQQHSPEFWLTSDLLTSNMAGRQSACTAFRVSDWKSADLIFVPFFASLSYNKYTKHEHKLGGELDLVGDKNQELQENLMKFLRTQPAWQASGGADHIIVIHHPNSMHVTRDFLRNAMFVVADFGRYTPEVANIGKDIVAPYKHVIPSFNEDAASFEARETLLFFQGAIVRKQGGVIRQQLYELLKNEDGVHFEAGSPGNGGIRSATLGMRGSKFCLNLAGDTPSSNRLFDAIASHCVPVIISDDIELPFEDELDYSQFCMFIKFTDALQERFIIDLLRSVTRGEWTKMWKRLKAVDRHFKYQHPTEPDDAVHMIWSAIARKVPSRKLLLHKQRHFSRSHQS